MKEIDEILRSDDAEFYIFLNRHYLATDTTGTPSFKQNKNVF